MTGSLKSPRAIDNPGQPWVSFPHVVSWWDMEKFSADEFYEIGRYLGRIGELLENGPAADKVRQINDQRGLETQLEWILDACERIGLKVAERCAAEFLDKLEDLDFPIVEAHRLFAQLADTIRLEMQTVLFFHLPSSQAQFYERKELFGREVSKRFSNLESDIIEAGNCLALGRGTACVFHLMRVMEAGVQELGSVLGIGKVAEKNWQPILDEVNKAIKTLPHHGSGTATLSEVAANLYSVKLAWRNEVMHPKATYTVDEATDVLRQVKLFMSNLVETLPPAPSTTVQ
jgi:hypothetical protein